MHIEGNLEVVELWPGGRSADPGPVPGRDLDQDHDDFGADPVGSRLTGPRPAGARLIGSRLIEWWTSGRPAAWRAGAWARIRRSRAVRPVADAVATAVAQVPQRAKIVIALLAIAAIGFVALGVASAVVLSDYVTGRADAQLRETSSDIGSAPPSVLSPRSDQFGQSERRMFFFFARPLPQGVAAQLRTDDGSTFREFGLLSWSGASGPLLPADLTARNGHPFTVPARATNDRWRVLATTPVEGSTLIVATDFTTADAITGRLTQIALVAGGLALAVMAFVGFRAVRSGAPQLNEIERTVEAAVAGDLTRRASVLAEDTSPGHVAQAVNTLIEQMGDARAAEERALRRVGEADRAVRLPLSVIQGFADYYREIYQRPVTPGEDPPEHDHTRMARLVDRVGDEAARIGVVLDDLLGDLVADLTIDQTSGPAPAQTGLQGTPRWGTPA